MKVIVAGGRGFIGSALLPRLLERGDEVRVLSRSNEPLPVPGVPVSAWDENPQDALGGAEAVINLCGSPIFLPKSKDEDLYTSRIEATRFLIQCMQAVSDPPQTLINASASWIYGLTGDVPVDEKHAQGNTKLAELCSKWEQAASPAEDMGVRVVMMRMGLVLDQDSSAMAQFTPIFKFYNYEPAGPGRRKLSWIHRADMVEMILFALDRRSIQGPLNATSPDPRSLHDFGRLLGSVMESRSWDFVPSEPVSSLLGDTPDIILQGARVLPAKADSLGFSFRYPTLQEALEAIYAAVPSL